MRIAVINNFYPPRPGGSAHLAQHLARAYAAAGHEVLVLTATYADAPLDEVSRGVRIVRVPAWTLPKTRFAANFDIGFTSSPKAKTRVFSLLDEFAPDVVHQHGQFFDLTWLSGWWARKRGVPTLLSIHTRLESPLSRFNSFVYATADRMLVVPMMRIHRPKVVVMDILMDRYIEKRYRRVISGKVAIPVGIDPEVLRGGSAEVAFRKLGFDDRPIILSIGHVIPQRSRIALVRALPKVLARVPDAAVVVIGGVYHDEFLQIAEQLGVRDAVFVLGAQPQTAIPDFLAAADVEVHELEGGGFGTASLEALAVGIPVVAAIEPDNFLDIVVEDGRELYITPPIDEANPKADPDALAEVLIGILQSPDAARSAVGANAMRLVDEHFAIEAVARRHLQVLADMAATRPVRSPASGS
ncbi:glycosyltransferase family 4 protein [Agromyces ramosus]|uniref:D-inositol 3-phosphate glycosyltransferase n=1 Tax=Agromyces ramosus TaxID=33879 RepID=A0ABU0RC99_9MICO|nr:glycosyltransferase family 4 protein [Agromyces ramosus]MDQ0895407.1 glycosyltransferase involved in cell wall biosynthesis [Agromyces ramosus]